MSGGDGHQRRRTRTRAALVNSALGLLIEGRTDVAVQEITERAGVAQGSFYNHFDSKEALFDAALALTMDIYSQALGSLVEEISDPAEMFTASFRLTGRLLGKNPTLAKLFQAGSFDLLVHPGGLRPLAVKDISAAAALGRFLVDDIDVAFMGAASAMLAMARLLDVEPTRDVAATADQFAAMSLRAMGCVEQEVAQLMARPIPEVPELSSLVGL